MRKCRRHTHLPGSYSDRCTLATVRNLHVADYVTLVNGVSGVMSILSSVQYVKSLTILIATFAYGQSTRPLPRMLSTFFPTTTSSSTATGLPSLAYADCRTWLYASIAWIAIGTFADVLDGRVARYRRRSSLIGQELDSLADLVSFGVAPATLCYAIGCSTGVDSAVLAFFVVCGLTRLARYNVTVGSMNKDKSGKIAAFEGAPIPTSLGLTFTIGLLAYLGYTDPTTSLNAGGALLPSGIAYDDLLGAKLPGGVLGAGHWWSFHPFVLAFGALGCMMASKTLQVPKL